MVAYLHHYSLTKWDKSHLIIKHYNMKKNKIFSFLLLATAVLFITSCTKDENAPILGPSLTVTESLSGSTGGSFEITQGAPLVFAWETRKGDEKLSTFSLTETGANTDSSIPTTVGGHDLPYSLSGNDRDNYVDTLSLPNAGTNVGTTKYTFSVVDAGGQSRSVSFDVTVNQALSTTPLSDPIPFVWTRVAGADATGLSQFGLKWTENTSTSAIVAKDNATTMVNLGSIAWTDIQTKGDLNAAIADGNSIIEYQGVSATANGTYDDVLGVIYNEVNYIIHITNGNVTTGSAGTTISITGQYKN